jgi:predicted nucleotidyltransferase
VYDKNLATFVKLYLSKKQPGFMTLMLFGSRAKRTNREDSDHDFYAIFDDFVDNEIESGKLGHLLIVEALRKSLKENGFNSKIDLQIAKQSTFQILSQDPETHAFSAAKLNIVL